MVKNKKEILEILMQDDFNKQLSKPLMYTLQDTVNNLFTFLYSTNETVKENAITAMGKFVLNLQKMILKLRVMLSED